MKDNKLIAEFMGYICSGDDEYLIHPETNYDHSINDEDWFLYSTSWDWLMPVIENIDHLQHEPVMSIEKALSTRSIDDTYKAVVEFINQLNNNNHER